MLLTSVIVILFTIGVYMFLDKVYLQPIKNRRAQKEFQVLLRETYAAKTMEELKDVETWFLEFILAHELTIEEKTWYNNMFFDLYAKRLTRIKSI